VNEAVWLLASVVLVSRLRWSYANVVVLLSVTVQ